MKEFDIMSEANHHQVAINLSEDVYNTLDKLCSVGRKIAMCSTFGEDRAEML